MPPKKKILSTFVAFDVHYADGTRTSNRRVPFTELGGLERRHEALRWRFHRSAHADFCLCNRSPHRNRTPRSIAGICPARRRCR